MRTYHHNVLLVLLAFGDCLRVFRERHSLRMYVWYAHFFLGGVPDKHKRHQGRDLRYDTRTVEAPLAAWDRKVQQHLGYPPVTIYNM